MVYVGLNEHDRALSSLETALAERAQGMLGINADPIFASLRAQPRFARIVEKVGMEP